MVIPIEACYALGALAGIGGVWVSKWQRGEIKCVTDMATTERARTVYSVAVQVIAGYLWAFSGQLAAVDPQAAFMVGLGMGGAIDAICNKAQRVVWSEEKRNGILSNEPTKRNDNA